jgi:hypothetical protein
MFKRSLKEWMLAAVGGRSGWLLKESTAENVANVGEAIL